MLPRAWSERGHPEDSWRVLSECFLAASGKGAALRARIRFVQMVDRRLARLGTEGLEFVHEVQVGGERWVAGEDARERELAGPLLEILPGAEQVLPIRIPEGIEAEWLEDSSGRRLAAVVRVWRELVGALHVRCERTSDQVFRVGVEVRNTTAWSGTTRQSALRSALGSVHVAVEAVHAQLVPPETGSESRSARPGERRAAPRELELRR